MDVQSLILKKLESLEAKVDGLKDDLSNFKIKVVEDTLKCKADLTKDVNKVKFGMVKMVALMAVSGVLGGGVAQTILKLF